MVSQAMPPFPFQGGGLAAEGVCAELRVLLARSLSADRLAHVHRVEKTAESLALRFGLDPHKARLAALAHDWAREWSAAQVLGFLEGHSVALEPDERAKPVLAHGKVAVILLRTHFGYEDPEIAEAVAHHTLGKAGMCGLAKLLFVADYLEPGRRFTTPKFRRQTAGLCLDCQVSRVIEHCVARHGDLHCMTKELYDQSRSACACGSPGGDRGTA